MPLHLLRGWMTQRFQKPKNILEEKNDILYFCAPVSSPRVHNIFNVPYKDNPPRMDYITKLQDFQPPILKRHKDN